MKPKTKSMMKAVLASVMLVSVSCFCQEDKELDPVTISNLSYTKSSRTGRNIVVIKGELFNQLPVHSLDELLRYVPGVEVQQRGPMGSQSDIVLRGGTFQQVLIILDGVRVNDPNTGHFNSYIPIAPAEIERIEILKGASSAIYGSEAVGGVVHVITKSFVGSLLRRDDKGSLLRRDDKRSLLRRDDKGSLLRRDDKGHLDGEGSLPAVGMTKKRSDISAIAAMGEYGLVSANMGGSYKDGKNVVGGGFLTNNSKGQPQRGVNGFFNNHTASVSYGRRIGDYLNVSVRAAYDDRDFCAQNFYTSFVSDTASERVKTLWSQTRIHYEKGRNRLKLDLGYKKVEDRYAYNSGSVPNQNTSGLVQATGTYEHSLSVRTSFIAGGQFQNRKIRSNDRGNHQVNQAAVFAILNQGIGSYVTVNPALRLDYDERAGAELVPQINISYSKGNFQLRGSAGKTIRNADFTERFNNYNKILVTSGSIGNPELNAERSFSYEVGADYWPTLFGSKHSTQLKISVTAFRREQTNVVDWVNTPYGQMPRQGNLSPAGSYALASNIAMVNTTGFETDIQLTKQVGNDGQLWSSLGLIWLDSEVPNGVKSFYISSHAKFMANFSLNYRFKRFGVSTTAIYKERDAMKSTAINIEVDKHCFMLNAKVDFSVVENRLGVFVEVDNILNESCRDLLGSLQPARWIMGGVKLHVNQ